MLFCVTPLYIVSFIYITFEVIPVVDGELINKIYLELKRQNLNIATAESCTGGLIGHTLTNISGSSEYFDRGIISYSNRSKMELLGVSEVMLKEHGAVSEEVAKTMADGIRKRSNVAIGISTTGIAGPTGGTKEKPVGLVYIAISTEKDTIVKKFTFPGDRLQNKVNACNVALNTLLDVLTR
jgi:nicotinamide-nucleotide amidase